MATIINTPGTGDSSGVVLIVGVVVAAVAIALFFMYGLPAIQNMSRDYSDPTTIKVELPTPATDPAPVTDPAPTTTP